jgi:hypothetical protein
MKDENWNVRKRIVTGAISLQETGFVFRTVFHPEEGTEPIWELFSRLRNTAISPFKRPSRTIPGPPVAWESATSPHLISVLATGN